MPGVLNHDDSPILRKRNAREQRRRQAIGPGTAVEQQAAGVEARNADARAQAAAEPVRESRGAHVQAVPFGKGASDGRGELRARTEARMRRQHLAQAQRQRRMAAAALPKRREMRSGAGQFGFSGRRVGRQVVRR